jgi:hypothetical protein
MRLRHLSVKKDIHSSPDFRNSYTRPDLPRASINRPFFGQDNLLSGETRSIDIANIVSRDGQSLLRRKQGRLGDVH